MKTIPLTQGMDAIVSENDYEELSRFKWCISTKGKNRYATRSIRVGKKTDQFSMHRQVMGFPKGKLVDHINRNTLDNRRENLRVSDHNTNKQNRGATVANKIGLKGVQKHRLCKSKWTAQIVVFGRVQYLGLFDSPIAAAEKYDEAAIKFFGEFACTNKMLGLL